MATVREVADDLGVPSGELVRRLRAIGVDVDGDDSVVDEDAARRLAAPRDGSGPGASTAPLRVKAPPPPPPPPSRASSDGAPAPGPTTTLRPQGRGEESRRPERAVAGTRAQPGNARRGRTGGSTWASQLAELPALVLLAFVIAVVIKTFLVQAFFIPSASMFPTLHVGDRVLVEKISYRLREPAAEDVVVFAKSVFGGQQPDLPWYLDARNFLRELLGLPTGSEQDYIKRIVAVGGDTLRYAGKPRALMVNGARVPEPYIKGGSDNFSPTLTARDCKRLDMATSGRGCRVPEGKVFVMGDNRGNSEDSRAIGPVRADKIVGHSFVIIWPPADLQGL